MKISWEIMFIWFIFLDYKSWLQLQLQHGIPRCTTSAVSQWPQVSCPFLTRTVSTRSRRSRLEGADPAREKKKQGECWIFGCSNKQSIGYICRTWVFFWTYSWYGFGSGSYPLGICSNIVVLQLLQPWDLLFDQSSTAGWATCHGPSWAGSPPLLLTLLVSHVLFFHPVWDLYIWCSTCLPILPFGELDVW